jgi:hypothetical protein
MNLPWDNKLFLTRLTLRKTPRGMLRNQALFIINRAPSLASPAPTPKRQVAQAGTAKSRRLCSEPVVAIIGAFLDLGMFLGLGEEGTEGGEAGDCYGCGNGWLVLKFEDGQKEERIEGAYQW